MAITSAAPAVAIALFLTGHAMAMLDKSTDVRDLPAMVSATGSIDPSIASGAKAIRIYLGAQQAYLMENGSVAKTYRISTGASSTPTPQGVFQIYRKQELRISKQAVPYRMPNYMAFTKNHAFGLHALPYLGGSAENSPYWREALDHIGTPVSHGCIRFLPEEAAEIYEWVEVGVPVIIEK